MQPSAGTVLYIGGFELPDRNAAAQRVRNNARVLSSLGYRVVLIGTSRARAYDRLLYAADSGDVDAESWEIGYPQTRGEWLDMIRSDWPLRQLVENGQLRTDQISTVICYNYPALAQLKIMRLARSWGASIVADCTEWYGSRPWNSASNIVKNFDVPLRMHWANRRVDGLITTSPFMTEFYRPTGLPIVEIPSLMEKPRGEVPTSEATTVPMPLFAVASGFGQYTRAADVHDRIDWILELLDGAKARGGKFLLRIVGVERERYLAVFPAHQRLLERLGDSVKFIGRQPRAELLRVLQESAFSFVLRHESRVTLAGFPTKYSESVTYGTPVIINALPSVRNYHVEGLTGISLDPEDREGAISTLCELLETKADTVKAMKRYCRAADAFTADAFVEPMKQFFSAIARKRNRAPLRH